VDGNKGQVRGRSSKEGKGTKRILDEGSLKNVTCWVKKNSPNDMGMLFSDHL
jgi:hypothetical protein